jgi:type VI secretion system protein ImpL
VNGLAQVQLPQVPAALKPYLPYWPYALGALLGLAFIVLIVWLVRRRRAARATSQQRELAPGALRKIWTSFVAQVPAEFRRQIQFFQQFIVLGDAGSGKSLLIEKYTDWKGQAAQFYPSYSTDPLLQIYVGSRAVVQELPATLLSDVSARARTALQKVWGPLFRRREPIVVVALRASALEKATPDSIRTQAQTLRGKINVLSRITGKPVLVRVVLTHVDQVEGYLAFSEFVEKHGIAHQITLDGSPTGGLATCLEPFEAYLTLALTALNGAQYLKVLTFLNRAPETFHHLGLLLKTLREPDPLSLDPVVKDLYLVSDSSGSPSETR